MNTSKERVVPDIKKTVIIEAPLEKVWGTVATAEGIASWFMPNDFQAEVGHEFHLQSPFGPSPCKVIEINAPHSLAFTWDTEGWIISFQLKEAEGKTEFTLIHSGWKEPDVVLPKANEKSSIIRDRMDQGWTGIVERLRQKVAEA